MSVKVFIADDHPVFRRGLIDLIGSDSLFAIIGETDNGKKALELIKKLQPDIALIDLSMPGMGGLEVIKEIRKDNPRIEFIILTIYNNEEYLSKAIDLDVKGYILKDNTEKDLLASMKAVARGEYYISSVLSRYLINKTKKIKALEEEVPAITRLTSTEIRVLKFTSENKSCKEIAKEMYISPKTVENHRTNISHKLNLKGRNSLLKFAIENRSSL